MGGVLARGPAYTWLLVTVFLPLSAMLYFSFLDQNPLSGHDAHLTLQQYRLFFEKDFYRYLTGRSLLLGLYVSIGCLVIGYPTALILARQVKARWREASSPDDRVTVLEQRARPHLLMDHGSEEWRISRRRIAVPVSDYGVSWNSL